MASIKIVKIQTDADLIICQDIRRQVFVIGQNVPLSEEIDGYDKDSEHFLLYFEEAPAGTARVRYPDNTTAKIERVAVLDAFQGKGLGKKLIAHIIDVLKTQPQLKKATLGSQVHAIPFYEKLGFSVSGDEYMDANIPHKKMCIGLK